MSGDIFIVCRSVQKEQPPTIQIIKLLEKKNAQYFYADLTQTAVPESEYSENQSELLDTEMPCRFCFIVLKKWPENSDFIDPKSEV